MQGRGNARERPLFAKSGAKTQRKCAHFQEGKRGATLAPLSHTPAMRKPRNLCLRIQTHIHYKCATTPQYPAHCGRPQAAPTESPSHFRAAQQKAPQGRSYVKQQGTASVRPRENRCAVLQTKAPQGRTPIFRNFPLYCLSRAILSLKFFAAFYKKARSHAALLSYLRLTRLRTTRIAPRSVAAARLRSAFAVGAASSAAFSIMMRSSSTYSATVSPSPMLSHFLKSDGMTMRPCLPILRSKRLFLILPHHPSRLSYDIVSTPLLNKYHILAHLSTADCHFSATFATKNIKTS